MIAFHRVLISTAILFCFGFGIWMFNTYLETDGLPQLILGLSFTAAALGLTYYLKNLSRFLGR